MMARGHVYSDRAWLSAWRMAAKRAVTEAPGARHAAFRFVTGGLDLFPDREVFLAAARRIATGMLVIYGREAPRKSKAEMTALAALPNVTAIELPRSKLSSYEEFPEEVAEAFFGHVFDATLNEL